MGQPNRFGEQVQSNLTKLDNRPEFASEQLWLTFYLSGSPDKLDALSAELHTGGWVNVQGGEGGFLYPKVHVEKSLGAIVRLAEETEKLCAPLGVEIDLIDADTSPDQQSQFETLYRSPT